MEQYLQLENLYQTLSPQQTRASYGVATVCIVGTKYRIKEPCCSGAQIQAKPFCDG